MMYILPNQPPKAAMAKAGRRNVGANSTTDAIFTIILSEKVSVEM